VFSFVLRLVVREGSDRFRYRWQYGERLVIFRLGSQDGQLRLFFRFNLLLRGLIGIGRVLNRLLECDRVLIRLLWFLNLGGRVFKRILVIVISVRLIGSRIGDLFGSGLAEQFLLSVKLGHLNGSFFSERLLILILVRYHHFLSRHVLKLNHTSLDWSLFKLFLMSFGQTEPHDFAKVDFLAASGTENFGVVFLVESNIRVKTLLMDLVLNVAGQVNNLVMGRELHRANRTLAQQVRHRKSVNKLLAQVKA
jgi:hypothetical protein